MDNIAIITGDMVGSMRLRSSERDKLVRMINSFNSILSPISETTNELFRGDSFQIRVFDPNESLRVAVIVRAMFRSITFLNSTKQWDCRLFLGIGKKGYERESLAASDGEAYQISGHGLDAMKRERLGLLTPWKEVNREFGLATRFADVIISNWTPKQSEIMQKKLIYHESNLNIASAAGVTRQNIDKLLKSANEKLINLYLTQFKEIVSERIS